MKQNLSLATRNLVVLLAVSICLGITGNAQDLKSKPQGNDLVKLNGTYDVPAETDGKFAPSNPVSAVIADLDGDGIGDLIIGRNDSVSIQRGDINAFAPKTQEAWESIRDLRYISPFEKETRFLALPLRPDFLDVGDFTRDGHVDIIAAARNGDRIILFEGDGKGNFSEPREVFVDGIITALTVGDANRADGFPDVIVGVGNEVSIYQGLGDIFTIEPKRVSLPNSVETIAVGQFDSDSFIDIAVGNGNNISIISGSDDKNTVSDLPQNFTVRSLIGGDFVPDRAFRTELAALDADGTVHIIARGDLDTRPVLPNEHLAAEVLKMQSKNWPVAKRILAKLSSADFRDPESVIKTDNQAWAEYDQFAGAAPGNAVSANAVLTSGRLSNYGEDLILLDSSNNQIVVMPLVFDPVSKEKVSYAGRREVVRFDLDNSPVAALPARLNFDGRNDLLLLQNGTLGASTLVSSPQLSFTVNSNGDAPDANPGNGICATAGAVCTLRAAVMEANRFAGSDSIAINSGLTITLSNGKADNDLFGENSASYGDLDIFCAVTPSEDCATPLATNSNDLSITGAVGGNTIQSGTFSPSSSTGVTTDRVFDIGQDGIFGAGFGGSVALNVTMSNLTIQNGNVREDFNVGFGTANYARGGAVRMDGFGQGGTRGSLTMTSVTINNNQADHDSGGVFDQYASINWTSVTATTNIGKAGPGGALQFLAGSPATLTVASSSFTGNESRIGTVFGAAATDVDGGAIAANHDANTGMITNTNFTNNISQDDGGALKAFNGAITVTGGTMSGNTARDDGGAIWTDNDTVSAARFLTLSGVTIRGNIANSDTSGGGDGGGVFRDRGTLNVTNCTIGGLVAGQPNTANNGGGIAHAFRVFPSGTNVATINIDNGSITGNNARKTPTTGEGGAIFFNGANAASPNVLNVGAATSVTIDENNSNDNAGGISMTGGSTGNLTRALISGNDADADTDGDGDGGGVFQNNAGGIITIASTVTFLNNGNGTNTTENGGAIFHSNGTLTLNSPPVTGNKTDAHGGGLFVSGGIVNVNSVTFSSSISGSGTEVRLTGGTTNLTGTNTIPGEVSIAGGALVAGSSTNNLGEDFGFSSGSFNAGTSTFNFNGSAAQQIYGGSVPTFLNVTDSNTTTPLNVNNNAIFNGNLTINSNTILNPAAATIISGAGTLTGSGTARATRTAATADFLSQYTITNKTLTNLTVEYAGSSAQSINPLSYGGLSLNNAAGASLTGPTSVGGNLNLVNGILTTGANTLTVTSGGTSSRTNGYVFGNLRKDYSGPGAFTFMSGTPSGYAPVETTVTAGAGNLTVTGIQGPMPLINGAQALQRYWTLVGTGITSNLVFNYNQAEVMGTESLYWIHRQVPPAGPTVAFANQCPGSPCVDTVLNKATINGITSFSNWTVAVPLAPTAATVPVSGRVLSAPGRGLARAQILVTGSDGSLRAATTNSFGYYRITDLPAGETYTFRVTAKEYTFAPRTVGVSDEISGLDFIAEPQ